MNDLMKLVLAGVAIYGVYRTGTLFFDRLDKLDRKGLNFADFAAAAALGGLLLYRLDNAADRTQALIGSRRGLV